MKNEHDDDMDLEVDEGAQGEAEKYAVVNEEIEERDAAAAEVDRMRELQDNLQKAEGEEVEEG